jgi:hypothetical protein
MGSYGPRETVGFLLCKELSEDFLQLITNMLKKEINKNGLENSPIYCLVNTKREIVVKIKSNNMWNTYYHSNARILTVINDIIDPIINRIKLGIEEYPDEKIKKKNGFIQHERCLDNDNQKIGIMKYGLYEATELNTRKIKRLTNKKQGITRNKNEEDENEEDENEEDENEEYEEDEEEDEDDDYDAWD